MEILVPISLEIITTYDFLRAITTDKVILSSIMAMLAGDAGLVE